MNTNESPNSTSIQSDVKHDIPLDMLKIQRASGQMTPEVLEMCTQKVDQMLEIAKRYSKIPIESLEEAATQIKNDQELLVNVTQFANAYEEVVEWNKRFSREDNIRLTAHHREIDLTFLNTKIYEIQLSKGLSQFIYALIYFYAHRLDSEFK